jgi:hypothetical protein
MEIKFIVIHTLAIRATVGKKLDKLLTLTLRSILQLKFKEDIIYSSNISSITS